MFQRIEDRFKHWDPFIHRHRLWDVNGVEFRIRKFAQQFAHQIHLSPRVIHVVLFAVLLCCVIFAVLLIRLIIYYYVCLP